MYVFVPNEKGDEYRTSTARQIFTSKKAFESINDKKRKTGKNI